MPEDIVPGAHQHDAPTGMDHALEALLDTSKLVMRLAFMLRPPPWWKVSHKQVVVAVGKPCPRCVELTAQELVERDHVDLPPTRTACLLDREETQPVPQPFHAQCRSTAAACGRPPGRDGGAAPSVHG